MQTQVHVFMFDTCSSVHSDEAERGRDSFAALCCLLSMFQCWMDTAIVVGLCRFCCFTGVQLIVPCSLTGLVSHSSGHQTDGAQLHPAHLVKPEPVQSNGPSHPAADAPPPIPDSNSNGCTQPNAPSHDQNGSLEPTTDPRETETAHERPAKRCRVEAEPLGQSEVESSRTQEN